MMASSGGNLTFQTSPNETPGLPVNTFPSTQTPLLFPDHDLKLVTTRPHYFIKIDLHSARLPENATPLREQPYPFDLLCRNAP